MEPQIPNGKRGLRQQALQNPVQLQRRTTWKRL
jgi:hypothetical protein